MTPVFSVVIPTYQRPETLFRVLDALAAQAGAPAFEVVVVDDGSRDDTPARLAAYAPRYPFRHLAQENAGPAAARNLGVREAAGQLILFLGDDTVPEPNLLAVHARAHKEPRPDAVAVLGYTTWPSERRVSPFLHHINEYGLQFGYGLIEDPERVPFNFFYTSNISLPRALLLEVGLFDTTFPFAAWEDIEIAYRLTRRGMRIVYRAEAVTRHHHDISFASFRRRQESSGESAAVFFGKHPELEDFLGVQEARALPPREGAGARWLAFWAGLAESWELPGGRRAVDRVLRRDYLRGLRRGLSTRLVAPSSGGDEVTPAEVRPARRRLPG
ncbi:MAG TPA: glycosyltransferase [Thermoanaerobaculia bacterium]|nr:glycosyltransferase [Thermoanaerobaculia bacterium]